MENSTDARPKLTTPDTKPVPTTLSGKLRAKLPSRGWMIFWTTFGTIGGLVVRDHYLTVAAKKRVADKVDILAKQSCGVQDMPRKVTVYITAPPGDGIHKTRHYFKAFVKPVFDAAAVDYEVKEGLAEGQIQAMVAADVRKKRRVAAGKISALSEAEQSAPIVLQGYNDGCLQSLDDPEPVVVAEKLEEASIKDEAAALATEATGSIESTLDKSEDTTSTEAVAAATAEEPAKETKSKDIEKKVEEKPAPIPIPQDEAYFSVPPTGLEPVGYIPFKNLTGFRNFHKKIFALFNSYDCVEYAGASVMKIAFAETKEMEKDDLEIGRDEEPLFKKYRGPVEINILDRVREQVKLFVTPENIPEPKKVEEDVTEEQQN
ncbi:mitochondrial import inner membrane translocase subunit tim54 [Linnemannia exigua]|uniref:Mitochondrial import inner membrane translocase subunit TIM54 n=1 Tax=Linnemannia exigua TaxID=604196 RepID=A0AAD4H981_9FUNG|nr:mitochondrial import inner membrane translocase subunit tim54 [Linnemannia exigua]